MVGGEEVRRKVAKYGYLYIYPYKKKEENFPPKLFGEKWEERVVTQISLVLPYPPSANRIWRVARGRIVLSDEARLYRFRVAAAVMNQIGFQRSIADPVRVTIQVFPPDRKRRDIDNIFKATLDALTHAKVWNDDSQVKRVVVDMCEPEKGGSLKIGITASPLGPPCD